MTYHLSRNGETYGPYEETHLLEMQQRGDLLQGDLVYSEALGEWKLAAEVFPAAAAVPVPVPSGPPPIRAAAAQPARPSAPSYEVVQSMVRREQPVSVLGRYSLTFGAASLVPLFGIFFIPFAFVLAILSLLKMARMNVGFGERFRPIVALVLVAIAAFWTVALWTAPTETPMPESSL